MSTDDLIHIEATRVALPLTAAARGIYYAQRLDPDVPLCVAAFVEFGGRVDPLRLAAAVSETAVETESALMRLVENGDDEPVVLIDTDRRVELGRRDFSHCGDPDAAARQWMDEHRSHVPDLFTDPLLQTYLLDLGEGRSIWYCWGHHLAFDGYAAMFMMLRVAQRYTAAGSPLPDASIASMADIVDLDADYRRSERFRDDHDYWSGRLGGAPGGLPTTSFASRADAAAPIARVSSTTLESELVAQIRARALDLGVRPASLITAAVALYLARFNDSSDVMLSLPVAVRDTEALRTSAGLTSNVVPVLATLDGPDGRLEVDDLIRAVHAEVKNAVRHQRFRHEDITADVLESADGRRGFFGPMVNVMLFFSHIDFGSLPGSLNILSTGPVEDASVNVYDSISGGMSLDLEANPNVYSAADVDAHHQRLVDFLKRFVTAAPDSPVTAVQLATEPEHAACESAATGERTAAVESTVTELLSEAYRRFPEETALIHPGGEELSYRELERRVAAAATALRARGIGPESVVGVLLARSIEQQIALHAVIAAGATLLPLSPNEPATRLRHILDTAEPALVITGDDGQRDLAAPSIDLRDLEAEPDPQAGSDHDRPDSPSVVPHPDAAAYVLFTSGSTGVPKGVVVSHRALVNRLLWMQETYSLTPDDRVLQKTPASFDVSVWEYFWPLTVGAAAVIAEPDGHRDPWYLRRIVEQTGVSALHFVPSMLTAFTETLGGDAATTNRTRAALASVRMIFTSGEALAPSAVAAANTLTDAPIHNLYGPTEAAIDITHHDACAADEPVVPIGRPVHNSTARVLDRRLQQLPVGAVGELYLGGIQLARGYRGRPGRTASTFIADPFGAGRLYRTGDLVRRRHDGELEYVGRRDSQIKIRGQRVELGEIENALTSLPDVRAAGAVVRDDLLADRVIIGYVTGERLDDRDLRAELTSEVPAHMIPTAIVVCAQLPTTANGKLDRSALPEPDLAARTAHVAPTTALERLVHDSVCAVLGLAELSMSAGFFDLGGNSLSATRVAARLSAATGVRVGIRDVVDASGIAGIVDALRACGVPDDVVVDPHGRRHARIDGPVPLSPAQHRIWLASRIGPESVASYHIPFTVRLVGELDPAALIAALNDVVARHEPLRTTVAVDDGRPYQQVWSASGPLVTVDRDSDPSPESFARFAAAPFDLQRDLPIRARLTAHGPRDHTIAVVIHHLAADGWSLAPLAADLGHAYRARRSGTAPDFAELQVTYRQAAAERISWLDDTASSAHDQIDFWDKQLAGAPVDTELPYDRAPSRSTARTGAVVRASIDSATRAALAAVAAANDTTAFMVVHAAVATLLRSLSESDDIVIGTPVSGRGSDELDPLVGMFVNTLALRTSVDKNATFAELLATVRDCDLAAFDNADVPFDRLVTELNPARGDSGQPYFDVSVALRDSAEVDIDLPGLAATAAGIDAADGKFALEFTVVDHPAGEDRMELELGYAAELFDRSTAVGLASRCVRLLQTVTAAPETAVGDACVLDPADRLDLVPAVGGGARPAEHLSQLLGAAVSAGPLRPAVMDLANSRQVSYRELDEASNLLARALIDAGAGPERYVAIALPRGIDWVIALCAVAKSGAAWVPVDPTYPSARIEFMLADSGADVVVTDAASRPSLPDSLARLIMLETVSTEHTGGAPITDSDRRAPVNVDQPAYVIYTSGTTGRPKGVVVSHRGLADLAAEQIARLSLTGQSRTLHLASPSFDASVLELVMAFGAGALMHVAPPHLVGGRDLAELMADTAITHAFLTPSLLTTMAPEDVPQLQTLVIGGEHPNAESVRRWAAGPRLFNAYGPTEATVVATMSQRIEPTDPITIGRPIRGVSALVLDERLRPVAPGVVGELYLSGAHLARGYHRVPSLTSKSFVANPFAEAGERMYRTGDLVRWGADRTLEFRGRADQQTKVRGHRIELGEIDAALAADTEVHDAVTVVAGTGDAARLVAYVTGAPQSTLSAEGTRAVRDRLAERLPRHMIPSAVILLDQLPLTPVGKVDTRSLPDPGLADEHHEHTPPHGPAERAVATAIGRLLQIEPDGIGRADDFFELGGNSLLATRLATDLEEFTTTRIPVRALFDDPRVCAIARLLDDAPAATDPGADAAVEAREPRVDVEHSTAPVDPGPAQQQLWFLTELDGPETGGGYHIAFALDLDGDLDLPALRGALHHVVARHEPLRTRYPDRDGRPVLDVLPADAVEFDLTADVVAADQWEARARAVAARPFDLTADVPIRAALHRLPDDDAGRERHRLTLVIHHIAADGASMAPLARDLGAAYADLHCGRRPAQPPLALTYRDYLRWQRAALDRPAGNGAVGNSAGDNGPGDNGAGGTDSASTHLEELTGWWLDTLDGIDPEPLLAPDVDAPEASGRAGIVDVPFAAELRSALRRVPVRGATEFMTLHAVLATLMHRMSADPVAHVGLGVSDVVIGTPVAGRADPGLADLVGMFVNSIPLRASVDSRVRFTDLLATIRDRDLDAIAHAAMPFENLVTAVAPPRTGRHPIFGVALTLDDTLGAGAAGVAVELPDLSVGIREISVEGARFDLEVRLTGDRVRFTYDTGIYSRERIADFADRFCALATHIADAPDRPLGDYPLGSRADRTATAPTAPEPRHLADLIDRACRAHPDTIAVEDGHTRLTYREAGRLTDRWARTLTALGVRPDDIVASAIGRSIESVLTAWAIAKTGAAVLPIDPRHPADRVRHMLADSGASTGVTTSALRTRLPAEPDWITVEALTDDLPGARHVLRNRPARLIDARAYVIYTSGTTGAPKGASVTHRGLAAFAATQTRKFGVDGDSRTLHFASPGFDASILELLLAVDAGATMVIAPTSIYGGDELTEFLAEQRVTHAFLTPAALSAAAPRALPDLRCIGVGGESFSRELVSRWGADRRFLNCYGPTETTIVAMMSELRPGAPITLGGPVDGASARILDARLRPLPPYATGDLYLTGPGLARGYLNRPAQTSAAFVAAVDGSGTRMYRTGDLASADLAGTVTFHGRGDRQVKVRGFRIELDEVDSVLAAHPDVAAAVTVVDGVGESARLVSYVTGIGGGAVPTESLTRHVAERLPRPMVPAAVVPLDALPMTVNGKIDHAALPTPTRSDHAPSRRPAAGAERALADLVADALGLPADQVGADDDFFALGGTSLQATTLVRRINAVHRGAEPVRVRMVFDHPRISALARLIDLGETADTASIAGDEPVSPTRFPLAPMQRRLWSLHRSDPGSIDYSMPFALRLHGTLDRSALRGALIDVADRHAVLRTVYADTDDGPVGIVMTGPAAAIDLVDAGDAGSEAAITRLVRRPFDLTAEVPIRATLTGSGDSHVLILVLHHIAADGGSMPIIIGDLLDAYRARTGASARHAAAPAAPDYRDYALSVDAAREAADRTYWAATLTGAPAETSVSADPAVADRTGGGTVDVPIDDALRDQLAAFARTNSTSAFTVLHTALAILLNRLGCGDDLVIGTPVDTRAAVGTTAADQDFRGAVGMFVNTVALRTRVDNAATAQSLLASVRGADLDAWDRLSAPFDDVVAAVNPPRLPGRSPLFQVALSVHDFTDSIAGEQLPVSADLVGEITELDTHTAKFDLQFTVTGMNLGSSAPNLSLTYARNRYDERRAEGLGVRLLRVVRALISDPERIIGDIRITDPLEAAALAPVRGPAAAPVRTYADLLDDAVRRNPDGIAVTGEHVDARTCADLTYTDLYRRANRLARTLLVRGAARGAEPAIAIAIPRSVEAVVAIWAVVRTGAAYVPVDPTYPADRIAHMLADAGVGLVVTTSGHAAALPDGDWDTLVLDAPDVAAMIDGASPVPIDDSERGGPLDPDQLAYVIYTSGSTGTPKGVLVPHRGLAAVHDELAARMSPDRGSRVLHFASPSFDASVLEFLMAAAGAATLVIVPQTVYGGAELQDFMSRRGVTHAFITPAAVATLSADAMPSLTTLAVGGEALAPALVRTWSTGRTLINVYGPTETTVITTGSAPLDPDDRVTIGTPNNGVSAVLFDDRLHPVPVGVPGELYLLGPQVTRGYHNRRGLTSMRYVAAPMALGDDFAGDRMYRTGDLACWNRDGDLEYLGRVDDQVQVRGFRVELGEIDGALTAEPHVRTAVTVAATSAGQTVLHSYVTGDRGTRLDSDAIRRALARRLPRHMVPTSVTVLDRLPVTQVGKVDRRALPAPTLPTTAEHEPARTDTERTVAQAFAAVLDVAQVGRDDNFFDVGGNSLLAATLATRLRDAGHRLSVPDVFAAPTPAELAQVLDVDDVDQRSAGLAPLLTLRRGAPDSAKAPLFVVHPAIGLAWSFTSLLPYVDADRPVYGLQNPALSGAAPADTIAALAVDYVRRIRSIAPHGPYRLLGWSLGGLIAQEVAVTLQREGDEVEHLMLLDSYVLADHPEMAGRESLRDLLGEFGIDTAETGSDPDLSTLSTAARAAGGPLAELSDAELAAVGSTFRAAGSLAARWRPRVFDGDAVFVSARPADGVAARDDWASRITGRIDDIAVDCSHARMLLPANAAQYAHRAESARSGADGSTPQRLTEKES